MARFNQAEWQKIFDILDQNEAVYSLPERRDASVIFSSFNIRALSKGSVRKKTSGKGTGRTQGAWDFLARYCSRCDLIAIQEVGDDLSGIRKLKESLSEPDKYGLVVSDVTGAIPGKDTTHERLAWLFRWDRVERAEMASDITYDRRAVLKTVFDNRKNFEADFNKRDADLKKYKTKLLEFKDGLRNSRPKKPPFILSTFLTFMRTPHTVAFRVPGRSGADDLRFHGISAHLLYGDADKSAQERRMEFAVLLRWLLSRTKQAKRMYYEDMILFGDLNLEFEANISGQAEIEGIIKKLNDAVGAGFKVNFPFITPHPEHGQLRTTARMTQAYDQIAFFSRKDRLPDHNRNEIAGKSGLDGYDYGVFNYANLFAKALKGEDRWLNLPDVDRKKFVKRFEHDVSDHLPIWVRLPIPGA